MATALDVAAYLVKLRCGVNSDAVCDTTKLQKLVYYSQGWHMAWSGKPLFDDTIEAWANGPVIRPLYERHRGRHLLRSTDLTLIGNPDALDEGERHLIEIVNYQYGQLTGLQLSLMTRAETPWQNARRRAGVKEGERSTEGIDKDEILEFFQGFVSA